MEKFNEVEYKNKFNKDNYERTNIFFPKGKKEKIKEYYKKQGHKSLNSYINYLIDRDMQGGGN